MIVMEIVLPMIPLATKDITNDTEVEWKLVNSRALEVLDQEDASNLIHV